MTLLTWKPPVLSNPRTISLTNDNHNVQLDPTHDYLLHVASPIYMLFRTSGSTKTLNLTDVWSQPGSNFPKDTGAYPASDPAWKVLHHGTPPSGDFVPLGLAGMAYVSPGYV